MSSLAKIRENPTLKEVLIHLLSPVTFVLRVVAILCAIIVFGCVADEGYYDLLSTTYCLLNLSSACDFALSVGVIGFLICLVFILKDVVLFVMDFSKYIMIKKVLILADITVTGIWWVMWLAAFSYTADQRRESDYTGFDSAVVNCMNSVVAFSFFSVLVWGGIFGVNVFHLLQVLGLFKAKVKTTSSSEPGSTDVDSKTVPLPTGSE